MSPASQPGQADTSGDLAAVGERLSGSVGKLAHDGRAMIGDVSELKEAAGDIAGAAVEQGKQLLVSVRSQATDYVDSRKDEAAKTVSDFASSLRETTKSLEDRPNIHAFVNSAADGLEQLASTVRDRSFAEIYGEAEAYARRQPVVVGALSVVAGFALARFIKSSAESMADANAASEARAGRQSTAGRQATARRPNPPANA